MQTEGKSQEYNADWSQNNSRLPSTDWNLARSITADTTLFKWNWLTGPEAEASAIRVPRDIYWKESMA